MRANLKLGLIFPLLWLLAACEETVILEQVMNRTTITLDGSFLTESPDELTYPVKVLFAIDMSLSMGDEVDGQSVGSDPDMLRLEAAEEFIEEYNTNENASFEILLWSSTVTDCTQDSDGDCAFTKDADEISRVIDGAANDTITDYYGAISEIQSSIQSDINDNDNLSRSKYIVIFLSDGVPNDGSGSIDEAKYYGEAVEEITEMCEDAGVGDFAFHTFLLDSALGDPSSTEYQTAEGILRTMAEDYGDGQYNVFESAESIDFVSMVDVRLTTEYEVKFLMAYNFNTIPGTEIIYADSDADGLTNEEEEELYGTDPLDYDSDDDGWGDYIEVSLSTPDNPLDPLVYDSFCETSTVLDDGSWPDTDSDGLTDCEEYLIGTSRYTIDNDNDGIPDLVEVLTGMNPLDDDTGDDSDWDGREDWQEVQQHTNVFANDPNLAAYYAYSYNISDQGLVEIDQGLDEVSYVREYDYTVSNIDVIDTMIAGRYAEVTDTGMSAGDNLIRFYIAQVPEDDPDTDPVYRVAEFYVNVDDEEEQYDFSSVTFELLE